MAERRASSVPPGKLILYERLLASDPGVEGKANFGAGYTAIDGNMYTMISKHGVVGIRLPEPERSAFLERAPHRAVPRRPRLAAGEGVRGRPGRAPRGHRSAPPDA